MVVDTSVWVEYLRATGTHTDAVLTQAVRANDAIGVPDVVRLELLAGAGSDWQVRDLQRLLARFTALPTASPGDLETAGRCTGQHGARGRPSARCWTASSLLLRCGRTSQYWRGTATSRRSHG